MTAELFICNAYFTKNENESNRVYSLLNACGPMGWLATNLLHAQKWSTLAKQTKNQKDKIRRYESKWRALRRAVDVIQKNNLNINFGWQLDRHKWVIYFDLPTGQVSFHSYKRYKGLNYKGKWNGVIGGSEINILRFSSDLIEYNLMDC